MKTIFYSLKVRGAVVSVLGVSLLTACANGGTSVTTEQHQPLQFAGANVELDLKSVGNHNFVEGDIVGYGTKNFIIDTGSQVNVLDTAIVQAMGLEKIGEKEVLSGGTDPLQAGIYVVPQLKLGDLIVKDAEFLSMELDGMSGGLLQGVLGMPLFSEFLLTIDSPHDTLKISRSGLSGDGQFVVPLDDSDSYMGVRAQVAGQDVLMVLDVGAPGGFTLPENIADTVPLKDGWTRGGTARLVGGERSLKNAVLDGDILLAGIRYENPGVAIMSPSPDHGNIGNGVLKDIVLKIDQKNGLLSFEKVTPVKKTATQQAGETRSLGLQFRGMPGGETLTIAQVFENSLGERSGFKPGDVMLSLNGKPTTDYDMRSLGGVIRSSVPLVFEIERDGERQTINIP